MSPIPKLLIGAGAILIVIGVVWHFGGKYLGLGRLPGDIAIERENFRFYFPLATSILLSIGLSLLFYLINRFTK